MSWPTPDAHPPAGDSRALVRRTLLQHGPLARAQLAERTGLSRPAITDICHELLEAGHIRETGTRTPGRSAVGRRQVQLDLNAEAGYALGVLVAAENSAITLLDLKGQTLESVRVTPPSSQPNRVLAFLAEAAAERVSSSGLASQRLVGVGVSVPGVVDSLGGRLRISPFFGWADVPVRDAFGSVFAQRISVSSPAQAIATAEMLFGSAARLRHADLLLVNVSTAIGAAFVLGGRLQRGADNASGMIGHIVVESGGPRCGCGRRGCLNAVASGDALVARAAEQGRRFDAFATLLAAANDGDGLARALLDDSARRVGNLVGDLVTALNPGAVTISGMVLQLGSGYVDLVRETALARAWLVGEAVPRIGASAFGIHAAAVGAAALALEDNVYGVKPRRSPYDGSRDF